MICFFLPLDFSNQNGIQLKKSKTKELVVELLNNQIHVHFFSISIMCLENTFTHTRLLVFLLLLLPLHGVTIYLQHKIAFVCSRTERSTNSRCYKTMFNRTIESVAHGISHLRTQKKRKGKQKLLSLNTHSRMYHLSNWLTVCFCSGKEKIENSNSIDPKCMRPIVDQVSSDVSSPNKNCSDKTSGAILPTLGTSKQPGGPLLNQNEINVRCITCSLSKSIAISPF